MFARLLLVLAFASALATPGAALAHEGDFIPTHDAQVRSASPPLEFGRTLGRAPGGGTLRRARDETGVYTCRVGGDHQPVCLREAVPSVRGAWATLAVGVLLVAAGTVPLALGLAPFDFCGLNLFEDESDDSHCESKGPDPGLLTTGALGIALGAALVATAIVRLARFKNRARLLDRMSFAVAPMGGLLHDARGVRFGFGLTF